MQFSKHIVSLYWYKNDWNYRRISMTIYGYIDCGSFVLDTIHKTVIQTVNRSLTRKNIKEKRCYIFYISIEN